MLDGLRLPTAQVDGVLVERRRGWGAGSAWPGSPCATARPSAVVAAFTAAPAGRRLPARPRCWSGGRRPARRYLLAASVLDRLCAPLCDELLDTPVASLGDRIEPFRRPGDFRNLERAKPFLVPLDDNGSGTASTASSPTRRGPASSGRPAPRRWRRCTGGPPPGSDGTGCCRRRIGHALAGGAAEDAVPWIEALTPTMFATMSVHRRLADWLAALPGRSSGAGRCSAWPGPGC